MRKNKLPLFCVRVMEEKKSSCSLRIVCCDWEGKNIITKKMKKTIHNVWNLVLDSRLGHNTTILHLDSSMGLAYRVHVLIWKNKKIK